MDNDYAPLLERSDSETEIFNNGVKMDKLERMPAPLKKRTDGTSSMAALMHILKSNVGTGLLALPLAIKNAGLIGGPIGLTLVAVMAVHSMHLLSSNAGILASRHKCTNLDYANTVNLAIRHGSLKFLQPYHEWGRKLVNLFIFVTQFGFCCVYFVFMAENLRQVLQFYAPSSNIPNVKVLTLLLVIPVFCITLIKSLRILAPFSVIANICVVLSVLIIFYFCLNYLSVNPSPFPHLSLYASWQTLPTAFGSAVFSFEAIAFILPLKNSLNHPEKFPIILNVGMVMVVALYVVLGTIGFVTFGDTICGSITLNLPEESLYIWVKAMYIFVIYVSYGLQFFIPVSVIIENKDWNFCKLFFLKLILVLFTASLAVAVPDLGDFIALIGACSSSFLALVIPAFIDTITRNGPSISIVIKNLFIMLFGLIGAIVGTVTSAKSAIGVLTSEDGEDVCVPIDWLDGKSIFNTTIETLF